METISTLNEQEVLISTGSDERGAIRHWGVTPRHLGMAEIVRFFNEEKEARGWGAKRAPDVTTEQHRAYELIEAKLDAAESRSTNVTREAEARAELLI